MINKFQEGGLAQAQQQLILMQAAQVLQAAGYNVTDGQGNLDQQAFIQAVAQYGLEKLGVQVNQQNIGQVITAIAQQSQMARKGTKLNYLKKITNNCPEGTQLVYYKAGGHICPKCEAIAKKEEKGGVMDGIRKELNGGQAPKKAIATKSSDSLSNDSSIKKPKQPIVKKVDAKKQTKPQTNSQTTPVKKLDPKTTKTLPGGKYPSYWTPNDRTTWESIYGNDGTSKDYSKKCGGKMKKDKCGSKLVAKNGIKAKACPKCGKVHSGKCGCKATKHQFGGIIEAMQKLQKGGSLKGTPFTISKHQFGGYIQKAKQKLAQQLTTLPEVVAYSKRPYEFDRRIANTGPGHLVISDILWDSYRNGEYYGDLSGIKGGRTIYTSPQGNDTIYMNPQPIGEGMGGTGIDWMSYKHGYMPIPSDGKNLTRNKNAFYGNLRKAFVEKGTDKETKAAYNRATREYGDGNKIKRTAPKATERYKDAYIFRNGNGLVDNDIRYSNYPTTRIVSNVPYSMLPAIITLSIVAPGDTVYSEIPELKRLSLRRSPVERSASTTNQKGDEYRILSKRFREAEKSANPNTKHWFYK